MTKLRPKDLTILYDPREVLRIDLFDLRFEPIDFTIDLLICFLIHVLIVPRKLAIEFRIGFVDLILKLITTILRPGIHLEEFLLLLLLPEVILQSLLAFNEVNDGSKQKLRNQIGLIGPMIWNHLCRPAIARLQPIAQRIPFISNPPWNHAAQIKRAGVIQPLKLREVLFVFHLELLD